MKYLNNPSSVDLLNMAFYLYILLPVITPDICLENKPDNVKR